MPIKIQARRIHAVASLLLAATSSPCNGQVTLTGFGDWPEGCDEVAFFEDLLDNLQIPNCQPDPDSLRSTNDPFSPDFGGNTPSPPPGSGAGSADDQDSENEYVMVPGDSGVSCAQACEDQGHANSTWCQQSKSVVHPYNRFYCLCGLASMADPVRHVNTSDGTVPTNYEYACAYNECDTACLNTIGFTYAIAAGLGLCAFFFVVGEVYSHCVGNAGRMLSVYGLYYLILFLGTFDWLSDMFFILYDLYDVRLQISNTIGPASYKTVFGLSVGFLVFASVTVIIPFGIADMKAHFFVKESEFTGLPCPYSFFKPCKEVRMTPVVQLRQIAIAFIILDLPQLAIQAFTAYHLQEASLIAKLSFVITGLLLVASVLIGRASVPTSKRTCTRFWCSKSFAIKQYEKRGQNIPLDWHHEGSSEKVQTGKEPEGNTAPVQPQRRQSQLFAAAAGSGGGGGSGSGGAEAEHLDAAAASVAFGEMVGAGGGRNGRRASVTSAV